jgi:hypothetical protein
MKIVSLATAALSLAACGGSSSLATDRNRAGTGSSSLLITGDVIASMTSGGPVTSFRVDLSDGLGNNVSGATVSIATKDLGVVPLVEANAGSGHYVNSKTSFPTSDFILSVSRGTTDSVQGVVVGNPGAHTINAPARSSVVPANQPLQISWTTPLTAKSALIETGVPAGRDYSAEAPDTGTYTIPATGNPARATQRLNVSRVNEVDIAAGLPDSRLRVTFTSTVDPYTVQ